MAKQIFVLSLPYVAHSGHSSIALSIMLSSVPMCHTICTLQFIDVVQQWLIKSLLLDDIP